ncbi:dihydrofolate reductase [Bittarella massiliensis]|uniref:NAD(P)-dependent oxidoreductase n=1 Tax=Bittarella massiliensis (ex Durand et al. 2017) TaxID=1720313 RepID=UPI00163BEA16|nr:NAD(P)-dependent oxidoreductase [Bittarella massiliensis (ex Durand et al. 2017)]MBC2871858.1 dihydrofolate reductase [Bittarella massiliensis (ex Durand et al. 2017)]
MSQPTVLFTLPYGDEAFARVEKLGYRVLYIDEKRLPEAAAPLAMAAREAEVLVGYDPFPHLSLADCPQLRLIQLVSVGFDHLPRQEIESRGIAVAHNAGQTKIPISEWVLFQLLEIFKNARLFLRQQAEHRWQVQTDILELWGKTVLFLGAGNIASETAKKCKAFGCTTLAVSRSGRPAEGIDQVSPIGQLEALLPRADALVCTLPATPATHHLLNGPLLQKTKPGCALVNVSRGSVIDTQALTLLAAQHHFRGVALDVFEEEPLGVDSPLWDLPGVYITPHNAIFSDNCDGRIFEMVCQNLKAYAKGEPLADLVDFSRGY